MSTRFSIVLAGCRRAAGLRVVSRHAGQDAVEAGQHRADDDAVGADLEAADGALVRAAAFLEHGDGLLHCAVGFKVAQHDDVVGDVAGVDRGGHAGAYHALLDADDQRDDAALAQIGQQLVQVGGQEALVRHRVQVAVQAVDDDHAGAPFDGVDHRLRELAGASSAGSICCIVSRPSSIAALSSMPSWLQRFSILLRASSNRNMAQGSRRALAAYTNCAASVDLPVPGGPEIRVLMPSSRPPPSSASSPATPLDSWRRRWLTREWAATRRG